MKYAGTFLLSFFLCSCSLDSETSDEKGTQSFEFNIVDTIKVPILSTGINFLDFDEKVQNFLFVDNDKSIRLLEVNINGDVLRDIVYPFEGPESIGKVLSAGGYINSEQIELYTDKGRFQINVKGDIVSSKEFDVPGPWFREKKIINTLDSEKEPRLSVFAHAAIVGQLPMSHPDYFKSTKNFTVYDWVMDSIYLGINFEEDSDLTKGTIPFADILRFISAYENGFVCLYSPEPKLFIYDSTFEYLRSHSLDPVFFNIPAKNDDLTTKMLSASNYTGMASDDGVVFATYRTGIDKEVLINETLNTSGIQELYNTHNKVYGQLFNLDGGSPIGKDFLLPDYIHSVASALGGSLYLLKSNGKIEFSDGEVYFIGQLKL